MVLERIKWIDSSRGVAILCLIFIHYIGAIEARGFISYELMNIIKMIFRIATPYFIFIFGFTFAIVYQNKVVSIIAVKALYKKLYYRLALVLIAREVIVLVSAVRYPNMAEHLWSILLYQDSSRSGEILTFYFFAIILAPIALFIMTKQSQFTNVLSIIALYMFGYFVGTSYPSMYEHLAFRLFFYDVYAFFPFFSLVMFGMYCGICYRSLKNDKDRLFIFLKLGTAFMVSGFIILQFATDTPVYALATSALKSPPHISYLLIYSGMTIVVTSAVAVCYTGRYLPAFIFNFLNLIGRNSLLSYVLHYFLFVATPISIYIFGIESKHYELYTFIAMLIALFGVVYLRDTYKKNRLKSIKSGIKQ